MIKTAETILSKYLMLTIILFATVGVVSTHAGQATPDELVETMVVNIDAKNKSGVQSLIHPQVVSYLRVTDPAMLDNITNSLMQLKIPKDYKMGVISIDELGDSGMASYDKATQTLTMMGSPAYYKFPPTHLMALVVEKKNKENKIVKVPLTPTPLPIAEYQGNWYIVIAVGKK